MKWFNDFSKGIFQIYSGNTLEAFQPLDFFHFYPMWYDLWVERVHEAIQKLKLDKRAYKEIKHLLPTPSNERAIIQKIVPSFRAFPRKDPEKVRLVTNFFARMLIEGCIDDPFAQKSNRIHNEKEILAMLSGFKWQTADKTTARKLGQLVAVTGSLVHGLYNDLVTDFGWDSYGPYNLKNGQVLLIRHFPDLQPKALWPIKYLATIKELIIYGLYEDVEWEISAVGCHTIIKRGNPISGLKRYAVFTDRKMLTIGQVDQLIKEFSDKAEKVYNKIKQLNFEQLKRQVIWQECYQLKRLFEEAGLDWRPNWTMFQRIKNKPLLKGLLPHGVLMTNVFEFKSIFGFDLFAKEVFKDKI